jgi:hypothetical protein
MRISELVRTSRMTEWNFMYSTLIDGSNVAVVVSGVS